jgi:hypothetical protein
MGRIQSHAWGSEPKPRKPIPATIDHLRGRYSSRTASTDETPYTKRHPQKKDSPS